MKPVAPALLPDDAKTTDQPTLQSEIRRLCDERASDQERITLPAPPTEEALRAATPFPPRDPNVLTSDTLPAPPPSSVARKRQDGEHGETTDAGDELPSTIPGPPRVPRIAGA